MKDRNIRFGVADEAFKYYTGVVQDSSVRQIRNFPESLWGKYPGHNLVPGGRDLFACQHIDLTAAQNDWAAFQLGVTAEVPFLLSRVRGLMLSPRRGVSTIRLDAWCTEPALTPALSIEETVADDDRSQKADILSRRESTSYDAYAVGMVWAEITVPAGVAAGRYSGGIRVYVSEGLGDEQFVGEATFTVQVHAVTLPDIRENPFVLDLWQHSGNIARMHEVERYGDEHFALLEGYVASLAKLGQKCVSVIASDVPWCGQSCHRLADGSDVYEYNMVGITRRRNGEFDYDFRAMQRYIDLCFRHGIDRWIKVFGLVSVWADPDYGFGALAPDHPDAIRLRYWDETDGCMRCMRRGDEIDAYIQALERYFADRGLLDRVLLSADEPMDEAYYRTVVERIRRVAPGFRFFAAVNHTEHIRQCQDTTASFCMILPSVSQEWDEVCRLKRETDKEYTWYVCCGPAYPNMFLHSNLLETRAVGALTAFLGLNGFLRWNYTVWNPRPRESLCWHHFSAGDNSFVYPGSDGRPLLSLRYQQLRRAIGDYQLIDLLRRRLGERAESVLTTVWELLFRTTDVPELVACDRTAGDVFTLCFDAYDQAKKILLTALEQSGEEDLS